MGESKIEMKIDEEIKPLKELCEKLVTLAKNEIESNPQNVDTHEFKEVCESIGAIADAKKDTVEACYKKYILKAMEEHEDEYGEEWDEEGPMRKYYPNQLRDSRGRFMSNRGRRGYYTEPPYYMEMPEYSMTVDDYKRNSPEYYRDLDRKNGRMYYTEPSGTGSMNGMGNMSRDSREGKSGQARLRYFQSKAEHNNNTAEDRTHKMRASEEWAANILTDIKEVWNEMSPEEQKMWKTKLTNGINAL